MASEVTRPTKAPHISFSQMELAAQCGEAYRRKYIEGHPADSTNLPAMAGTAFHRAVQRWETAMYRQPQLLHDDFPWPDHVDVLEVMTKKALLDELDQFPGEPEEVPYFGKQDLQHWRKEKLRGLAATYLDYRQLETSRGWHWVGAGPEEMLEVEVRALIGGHEFLGFIDMLFIDSSGRLVIRDLKTGEAKAFHAMQLEQYRLALKRATGVEADYGQLLYVKREKPYVQVVKWGLSDDHIDEMARRLRENVEGNTLMVNGPFTGHCTVCDFRPVCPWGDVTPHGSS